MWLLGRSSRITHLKLYPLCDEDHIGETGNLRQIVAIHSQQIQDTKARKIPLRKHLDKCSSDALNINFSVLQTDDVVQRRQKETYFIKL